MIRVLVHEEEIQLRDIAHLHDLVMRLGTQICECVTIEWETESYYISAGGTDDGKVICFIYDHGRNTLLREGLSTDGWKEVNLLGQRTEMHVGHLCPPEKVWAAIEYFALHGKPNPLLRWGNG